MTDWEKRTVATKMIVRLNNITQKKAWEIRDLLLKTFPNEIENKTKIRITYQKAYKIAGNNSQ